MSYYFWLGAEAEDYRRVATLKVVDSPNYPDPPYHYEVAFAPMSITATTIDK